MTSTDKTNTGYAGGAAGAGGVGFQAAVTAIALVALARGQRLQWIPDTDDAPSAVLSETHGPGDDLQLVLSDGKIVEVQCKKGLTRSPRLWKALLDLAEGVHSGATDYGVLAICPRSGGAVRGALAQDLRRLADGRADGLSTIGREALDRLNERNLPVAQVCSRLTIQVIAAIDGHEADIRMANVMLEPLLARNADVTQAWRALEREGERLIRRRGASNAMTVGETLRRAGVSLVEDADAGPTILAAKLSRWTLAVNGQFKIIGVTKPLSTLEASLDLSCHPLGEVDDAVSDLKAAVDRYHNPPARSASEHAVDTTTLGRFYRHAVLLAGPGMGKTTLTKRLALEYALDGYPVLRVPLRELAQRMRAGEPFLDAAFNIGLADSGISPAEVRLKFADWVLLADGLDECGELQEKVAEGLIGFATSYPRGRAVVTSRPVGYQPARLAAWRHYELEPFETYSASHQVGRLLEAILPEDDPRQPRVFKIAAQELSSTRAQALGARSAFFLSLAASLLARGGTLSGGKADLYQRLLKLIEEEPSPRAGPPVASGTVLRAVLVLFGWVSMQDLLQTRQAAIERVGGLLAHRLGEPLLKACDITDRCLSHWESLGVVETLRHGSAELLVFMHKTFGEQLAARHLVGLSPIERDAEISALVDVPAWREVIDFAGALGLTNVLVGALLGDDEAPSVARVRHALELAASHPPLEPGLAGRLLSRAYVLLDDPAREVGIRIANPLMRFWDQGLVGVPLPPVSMLASEKLWVQLAAWACRLVAGPEHYALADLEALLRTLPEHDFSGFRYRGRGLLVDLGDDREARLAERVILLGARQLVLRSAPTTTDEILGPLFLLETMGRIEYLAAVEQFFTETGRRYPLPEKSSRSVLDPDPPDYRAAARKAFVIIASALALPDEDVPSDEVDHHRPPLDLAAFFKLSEINPHGREVWTWSRLRTDRVLRHVMMTTLAVSGLSEQAVRRQARVQIRKTSRDLGPYSGFPYFASIDVPPLDWSVAKSLTVDATLLHAALQHPVDDIVRLAAEISHAGLSAETVTSIAKGALDAGRPVVAAYGALLLKAHDPETTGELVFSRLQGNLGDRDELFYQIVGSLPKPDDATLLSVLRNGLWTRHDTAVAAAKAALKFAQDGRPIRPLLSEAWTHWQRIEVEWSEPSRPGVSPREALFEALSAFGELTTDFLIDAAVDPHVTFKDAKSLLTARLGERPEELAQAVEQVLLGSRPDRLLILILGEKLVVPEHLIVRIVALLGDADPERRRLAARLAENGYLSSQRVRQMGEQLTSDAVEHLRELGWRLLRKLEA